MKPYEQLVGIQNAAEVAYAAWEAEMTKFSQAFLKTLKGELGWPDQSFTPLVGGDVPAGGRRAAGGYVDAEGYHFAVRIGLGRSWLQVVFIASRSGTSEQGVYTVRIGEEAYVVELDDAKTFSPIVDGIVSGMKKTLLEGELAVLTGYTP